MYSSFQTNKQGDINPTELSITSTSKESNDTISPPTHKTKSSLHYSTKKMTKQTKLDKQYEYLVQKIKGDEKIIKELEAENRYLKQAISHAEETIKAYPEVQRNYEQLAASLSQVHKSPKSTIKKY